MITSGSFTNNCQQTVVVCIFLKNSLRILIVHVFALDHLRREDNKTKNFKKNFGLEFNCAHERIIPTLDFESLYCNIFFGHQA